MQYIIWHFVRLSCSRPHSKCIKMMESYQYHTHLLLEWIICYFRGIKLVTFCHHFEAKFSRATVVRRAPPCQDNPVRFSFSFSRPYFEKKHKLARTQSAFSLGFFCWPKSNNAWKSGGDRVRCMWFMVSY